MGQERWGSLSVRDHVDTQDLVTNVLLYDRLIVPVMTEQEDRDERAYWVEHGWDPELQQQRLTQLGELAVPTPWDKHHREMFIEKLKELKARQKEVDNFALSREVVAQNTSFPLPPKVHKIDVIAAYNSAAGLGADFLLEAEGEDLACQASLIGRELAIPDMVDPEESLDCAIELSKSAEFRERRANLFDWQERCVAKGYTAKEAVAELADMAAGYNKCVKDAAKEVRLKFAFAVAGAVLGLTGVAIGNPGAAGPALLAIVQFATFDKKPVIKAGRTEPAAIFHDIEGALGLGFAK